MAVDNAILEAVNQKKVPPTLRLYAWNPPCLSLGISQPISDIDRKQLETHGWDLVRRPTGGRAILHTDELTYAVIGRKEEPRLVGSVLESYQRLSRALYQALLLLNLPVQIVRKKKSEEDRFQAICFEYPSDYEITVQGKKLLGSAQARQKSSVLQHGSLPLSGDLTRITKVLRYESEEERQTAAQRMLEKATHVEAVLGTPVPWEKAAEAFQIAFQEALNLTLESAELTPWENQRAQELEKEKYAHPAWNERV
jgi:lipoate-protein ligase A